MSLALENTLMQIYDSPRMMQAGGEVGPMPQSPMPMMQAPSAGPEDDLRQVMEALMQERMTKLMILMIRRFLIDSSIAQKSA